MLVSVSEMLASPPTIKPENPFQFKMQNSNSAFSSGLAIID